MDFLDRESEQLLQECLDNELTLPQMLKDKLNQCASPLEASRLRIRIDSLVKKGYLADIVWEEGLPFGGYIDTKGLNYFKRRDIYVRARLREYPDLCLDAESEACLQRLNAIESDAPHVVVTNNIGPAEVLQNLINHEYIQTGPKGISYFVTGGFAAVVMILPKGRNYFKNKEDVIEEILAFPQESVPTQINVSTGNNSQVQIGNGNYQNAEYNFELAQEAIEEILSKIDELGLNQSQMQEVVENLDEAKKLVKEKKKGPLKTILKGVWEVIKGVGFPIASSLILAQLQ